MNELDPGELSLLRASLLTTIEDLYHEFHDAVAVGSSAEEELEEELTDARVLYAKLDRMIGALNPDDRLSLSVSDVCKFVPA